MLEDNFGGIVLPSKELSSITRHPRWKMNILSSFKSPCDRQNLVAKDELGGATENEEMMRWSDPAIKRHGLIHGLIADWQIKPWSHIRKMLTWRYQASKCPCANGFLLCNKNRKS